ncbi:MAG: ADP-ribosyltransferase family protein [Sulfobacillus sp.]
MERMPSSSSARTKLPECPPVLLPIDGQQCPAAFPQLDAIHFAVPCCRKKVPIKRRRSSFGPIEPKPMPFCEVKLRVKFGDANYELPLGNEASLRGKTCEQVLSELPKPQWLRKQMKYVRGLSDEDRRILLMYTYRGDRLLNDYLRNGRKMTADSVNYLRRHFQVFRNCIMDFGEWHTVSEFLEHFDSRLRRIIDESPPTDARFVLFRGSTGENYFENTTKNGIYRVAGMMSTAMLLENTFAFAESTGKSQAFFNQIVVPKGSRCLYNAINFMREHEVIIPDGSRFYITTDFRQTIFPEYVIRTEKAFEAQVDEIVLLESDGVRRRRVPPASGPTGPMLKELGRTSYLTHFYSVDNIVRASISRKGTARIVVTIKLYYLQPSVISSAADLVDPTPEKQSAYADFGSWCEEIYPLSQDRTQAIELFLTSARIDAYKLDKIEEFLHEENVQQFAELP